MQQYGEMVLAVLGAGYAVFTLVFSGIGDPVRRFFRKMEFSSNLLVAKAGEHVSAMLKCPFCTGFWVCVVVEAFFRFNPITHGHPWAGMALTTLAMSEVAAFVGFASGKALEHLPGSRNIHNEVNDDARMGKEEKEEARAASH